MEEYGRPTSDKIVFRLPGIRALRIPLQVPKPRTTLSSALFLVYGFASVILLSTILLILPVSSRSGQFTSPVGALFTATSAMCLTGLVVVDTGTYWSTFGQGVLLALFQIGGLGFISGGYDVLAIDKVSDIVENIAPNVGHAVRADATNESALKKLRINNFNVAVVAIGAAIQESVMITILLKKLGVRYVVARADNELHGDILEKSARTRSSTRSAILQ